MQNITNDLDVLGESLLWNKIHRIKYLPGLILCVIAISLTVMAAPADLDPLSAAAARLFLVLMAPI